MPLPDVNPKQEVSASHYRKLLYLLSGKVGDHQQTVSLTGLSSASEYALELRNRTSPGLALRISNHGGTDIFRVTNDEARIANLALPHQTAPATVTAGQVALYAKTDNLLYYKTSAGVETVVNGVNYGQNFLTNPGFEIWSRGAGAFTTTGAWTADKWALTEGAASTTSISRTAATDPGSEFAMAWAQSATGATSTVSQAVEKPEQFRGKTVTFSARIKTAYASAVRVSLDDGVSSAVSSLHTGGNTYETLSATLAVGASATALTVTISLLIQGQAHTGEIDNGVLAISSAAIGFEPILHAEDLARCRRFYQVHEVNDSGRLFDATDTVLYASFPLTPPMSVQASPTITSAMDVLVKAGTTAGFTNTSNGVSSSSDLYSWHSFKTVWTKAATDTEDAYLSGVVVIEIRV